MIKVLELFSGYGGASFALKKAGIPYQIIGYSDIDNKANDIFALNHGSDIPQLGDITRINPDKLEDFDLLTGGFPCQSFSIAGKRRGFEDTRGTLFFDILRIAKVKRPRWMLLENVKGLLSHDDGNTFKIILQSLKDVGYIIRWKVLNSKDFDVPQNRERVWFVCFRDKTDAVKFSFPEPIGLNTLLKDILCDEVPKKYYLNEIQVRRLFERLKKNKEKGLGFNQFMPQRDVCGTLCARDYRDGGKCVVESKIIPILTPNREEKRQNGRRCKTDGEPMFTLNAQDKHGVIMLHNTYGGFNESVREFSDYSPTIRTPQGGGHLPVIIENFYSKRVREYKDNSPNLSANRHGLIILDDYNGNFRYDGCIGTITPNFSRTATKNGYKIIDVYNNKIQDVCNTLSDPCHNNTRLIEDMQVRRLMPIECFRLMGFFNDEINLKGFNDTSLYKLAGNGWEITAASKIFEQMFKGNQNRQKVFAEWGL